ncbi:hypothetical protein OG361_33280 [Streptomyces sp. NBC_00090]|uniref:hypothetical protein n=1 Tax=Streptomyces sp. NBC_00090 TaxID=2903619 RepID=UPI00324BCE66
MPTYEGTLSSIRCDSPRSNRNSPHHPAGSPELDVVSLRWDGEQVWRDEMEQGRTRQVDVTRQLPLSATIDVVVRPNEDGSVEDVIGTVELDETLMGTGIPGTDWHVRRFVDAGADYELTFKVRMAVTPVDPPPEAS